MQHDGSSNFIVKVIDEASGEDEAYLSNEIGNYDGRYPLYVPSGSYVLDIAADGNWEITVRQPRPTETDVAPQPHDMSDTFPNYSGPFEFSGLHRLEADYNDDSNFIVWILDINGQEFDIAFNEIGPFEGEITVTGDGFGWVRVEAVGQWNLTISEG